MTAPAAASLPRMTSDEFLVWAEAQSDAKFELHDGAVVAMAGERRLQGMVKGNAFRVFDGVLPDPCQAYVDGIAVRVSERTTFIPDVVVDCGNQDDLTEMTAASPVIVIEVLSDSTAMIDTGIKLEGYFAVPSIAHYLVVDGWNRRVTWHSRDQECWRTSILRAGAISLDPPGISVSTDDFWRGLPEEGAVQ